jgi:single-stranded DNA-binding protein
MATKFVTSASGKYKNYKGDIAPGIFGVEGVVDNDVKVATNTKSGQDFAVFTLKLADAKTDVIYKRAGIEDCPVSDEIEVFASSKDTFETAKNLKKGQKIFVGGLANVKDGKPRILSDGIIPYPAQGEDIAKQFYAMKEAWDTGERTLVTMMGVIVKGKVFGKDGPVIDKDNDGNDRIAFNMRMANTIGYVNSRATGTKDDNKSNFVTVTITGPMAGRLAQYLTVGKMILLQGSLYVKQGEKYTNYAIYVNDTNKGHYGRVVLLGDAKSTKDNTEEKPAEAPKEEAAKKEAPKKEAPKDDDDFDIDELFEGADEVDF